MSLFKPTIAALVSLASVMLLTGCWRSGVPVDNAMEPYASDRGAVRLPDGRLLNIVCMGRGSPTVILTAGLGDFTGWAWSAVQAGMARSTRVCAWDRPGFGLSDGSPDPQTAATRPSPRSPPTGSIKGSRIPATTSRRTSRRS